MNMQYIHPADQLVMFMQRIYDKGLTTTSGGNLSIMDSDGNIWITPFGLDRDYLTEEDLVRIKRGMKEQRKIPSRAVKLHEEIYGKNPEIRAILLAHPVYAMAFAVTDAEFYLRTIPESYILLRDVKKIAYRQIFEECAKTAQEFGSATPALMVENDCVIVTGSTLLQAFGRLEVMEVTAHSIIDSLDLGKIVHITDSEVDDLKKAFYLEGNYW